PAVGPHRRLHRHPHRAYPSLSARRPRQDRTFLPFRARAVSGLARSQSSVFHRATQRTLVALARHRLSPPRTQFAPSHAAGALAARHRTGSPTSSGHRHAPSVLSSRGPAGAQRFHFPVEESFLRSAFASGRQAHRGALRSARSYPTGDLLRRQARGPGAPGGRGRQRIASALGNGGEVTMWESYFGFKKTPFSDSPDAKQLFASQAWNQVRTRLE